jgi:predicted dinucleotide-binding enzyme
MRIAIIGAGQVGQGLARAFRRAGHSVFFGVRDEDAGKDDKKAIREAVAGADLSILAVPYGAVAEIIGDQVFRNRIVVDATNPLTMGERGLELTLGFSTSGAEEIAAVAPQVRLVKAFNQTGFENMTDASVYSERPVMFVASDDSEATATVLKLVDDAGFDAIDLGPLRQARLLEPFGMLGIELAHNRDRVTDFAFRIERNAGKGE